MSRDRLIYLPLGGAGEIGMNAYVYGYGPEGKERYILIDLGVTFPDMDGTPGVDLILPDISWLADRADRLDGLFITHAHEDHVGAVGHLFDRLRCPVFARPFTANIARRKMVEKGHDPDRVIECQPWPAMVDAGPFKVGFLPTSHSIPEASAMVIDSPDGRLVHTGDFKIDTNPVVGEPFDEALWRSVGDTGVKALICDSTNVFSHHPGRSESEVGPNLKPLVAQASGMMVATTFASNIARLKSLAEAGRDAGRSVVLMGRAMKRMVQAAVESGVLTDFPSTISPEEARDVPRDHLMLIVTGSQGERRAASAQLARGRYLGHEMKEGDTFLFSSKTIPGNETHVSRIMNALSEIGVDVIDESGGKYHVSGHANQPDLKAVQDLIDPQWVIPMHGEHRHLREHVKLAKAMGRGGAIVPNGTMVSLSGNAIEVVDHVDTGRIYLDGDTRIGALDGVVRDRIRLALHGLVVVGVIVDEDEEPLEDAWIELRGIAKASEDGAKLIEALEDEMVNVLARVDAKTVADDRAFEDLIARHVRKICVDEIGKRPEVAVLISRLAAAE